MYTSPVLSREPAFQSASWIVAACELGCDCTRPFPGLIELCAESGACTAVQTASDFIQGAPDFARIYTAGEDIAYKIRARDWAGLEPYLEMRP